MDSPASSTHHDPTRPQLRSSTLPVLIIGSLLLIGTTFGALEMMIYSNHAFWPGRDGWSQPMSTDKTVINNTGSLVRPVHLKHSLLTNGISPQKHRRQILGSRSAFKSVTGFGFPGWIARSERQLLATPIQSLQADIVVAQDGSGTVTTISEAINKVPNFSPRPIVIFVKAGIYAEKNLSVGGTKTNLWLLGEGTGRTVIIGNKSKEHDHIDTYHTTTFVVLGSGFLARGISFVNEAGPANHQAVALRVEADRAVFYQCEMKGYQDTLYVHSSRQFYRECDIFGTVDFIFGHARAVFQNCTIWVRKPLPGQKNTITAQNRRNPTEPTGISIHACHIRATADLEAVKSSYPTYLGRPWSTSSRVVYMESYIGDHVDPRGWLDWDGRSQSDELYYGEYGNLGPGANTTQRVKWVGLHVNMTRGEAKSFTVDEFILGQDWIPATGVPYQRELLA